MDSFDSMIATLNTIGVGDVNKILASMKSVKAELERRQLTDLATKLDECRDCLVGGDLEGFRRARATVVSRLGHLRPKASGSV